MARSLTIPAAIPLSLVIFLLFLVASTMASSVKEFSARTMDKEELMGLNFKEEKFSHFHFYWHDVVSGPNPTSVRVTKPVSNSATAFGLVNMIDNPLTAGPELGSRLVGRAQGFYASACQQNVGLLMAMNFAFVEGKYNGSALTVMGRNMVFTKVREMPIIGGSGLFRFARGYVQAKTHSLNMKTGDATVQYDCYVMHY